MWPGVASAWKIEKSKTFVKELGGYVFYCETTLY